LSGRPEGKHPRGPMTTGAGKAGTKISPVEPRMPWRALWISIAVMAPAFSADCIETLEEINGEIREAFEHAGGESFTYIPCLNDDAAHIEALAAVNGENRGRWLPRKG